MCVLFAVTFMKRLSPFHRWENHVEVLRWTLKSIWVDASFSVSMTGVHLPFRLKVLIQKTWSSLQKALPLHISKLPICAKASGERWLNSSGQWCCLAPRHCLDMELVPRLSSSQIFEGTFLPHETVVPQKEHQQLVAGTKCRDLVNPCWVSGPQLSLSPVPHPSYLLIASFQPMHLEG